jgi:hypothetical protein
VLAIYCTLLVGLEVRRWTPILALAAVGSAGLLIKETSVLVYGPCLVCALYFGAIQQKDLKRALVLVGAAAVGAMAVIVLSALFTGGLSEPLVILRTDAKGTGELPYPLLYCSGPGYFLLLGFEALSPLTLNLAALGMLITLIPVEAIRPALVRLREALLLLALACVSTVVFMVVPHWLNIRYISPVYAPLCLFAGVGLWQLFVVAQRTLQPFVWRSLAVLAVAAVVVSSMRDYTEYEKGFVRKGTNDLAIRTVLAVARSSP